MFSGQPKTFHWIKNPLEKGAECSAAVPAIRNTQRFSDCLRQTENCLPNKMRLIQERLRCDVCHGRSFSLYSPPSTSSPNQKAPMSSGLSCPTESCLAAPDHIANGPRSAVLRCAGNTPGQGSEETTAVFRGIRQLLRGKQLTVH